MVEFLCMFFPALLATSFYNHLTKKKPDWQSFLFRYASFTLIINFVIFTILLLFFGNREVVYSLQGFSVIFALKYLLMSFLLAMALPPCFYFITTNIAIHFFFKATEKKTAKKQQTSRARILKYCLSGLVAFIAFLLFFSTKWLFRTYGDVTVDQLLFHLRVPLKGTNSDYIISYISRCLVPAFLLTLFCFYPIWRPGFHIGLRIRLFKISGSITLIPLPFNTMYMKRFFLLLCSFLLIFSAVYSGRALDITEAVAYIVNDSTFIEENYVDPQTVGIRFPENKKNLIFIFVESLEASFMSTAQGGAEAVDLIPELSALAETNISFSHTDRMGGAIQLPNTQWTIAGMVAQHSGLPLKIPVDGNDYGNFSNFLPGAYNLGDILREEGYNQTLLIGSEVEFGGRDGFFTQHGDYNIFDYNTAIERGLIPPDYKVWWGYEDEKLFTYAQEELLRLAALKEPFNFTMLTADTHASYGNFCPLCLEEHEEQYANVISCTSRQVSSFISWIQEQDFYEDSVIVVTGDHLSMEAFYFRSYDSSYERTVFNMFINSSVSTDNLKNRAFSTIDIFPTTLASMGVTIEGNRLALGTNLFSDTPSLLEVHGRAVIEDGFNHKSSFYNEKLIYSSR